MKIAKFNQADMDATLKLLQTLEAFDAGFYPTDEDEEPREFDLTGRGDEQLLQDFYNTVMTAFKSGYVGRFVWNAMTAFDPDNKIINPDADTLELHPHWEHCEKAADYYRACLLKSFPKYVPSAVKILRDQKSNQPFAPIAWVLAGEHVCSSNNYGEISVMDSFGNLLRGIKHIDFEVIAWKENLFALHQNAEEVVIKFTDDMVKAIRVGQKTQTRREVTNLSDLCSYKVGEVYSVAYSNSKTDIKIRITSITAENLHDISEEDVIKEGVPRVSIESYFLYVNAPAWHAFRDLWISIFGFANWQSNPLVWVINFEVVK
ncbi:MAG: hypothetical protein PHF58_13565 [Methylotenera sp.]|nr:hypothetical protein [Methylotenera sp.]